MSGAEVVPFRSGRRRHVGGRKIVDDGLPHELDRRHWDVLAERVRVLPVPPATPFWSHVLRLGDAAVVNGRILVCPDCAVVVAPELSLQPMEPDLIADIGAVWLAEGVDRFVVAWLLGGPCMARSCPSLEVAR